MSEMPDCLVSLRNFERSHLPTVEPLFRDPATQLFDRYLAHAGGRAVGYVDCGTFDRCTVYGGQGPDGPIITEKIDVPTGSIAFVIDPALRGRGLERAMIAALREQPELRLVELFEAGVERENTAPRHCLEAAGFQRSVGPDFEGMLYYRAWRGDHAQPRTATA